LFSYFRCAYQANVMNTFDKVSSGMVCNSTGMHILHARHWQIVHARELSSFDTTVCRATRLVGVLGPLSARADEIGQSLTDGA
jgi:hypothetical protein